MIDEVVGDPEVSEELTLPELLAETPAGPQLAALLASVERDTLAAGDVLRVAKARQRLIAHQEAQLLADLHAVARTVPDDRSTADVEQGRFPVAEAEAAFALRWTYTRASGQIHAAGEVIDRLPRLFEALNAGCVDAAKVRVFTSVLGGVDDQLAAALVEKVIDAAPQWTTAQLRARLRLLLRAAAPELVEGWARQKITGRRVVADLDDETGLAGVAGHDLAPHRVSAVMERLTAIAKAAKAAGDQRSMHQIRADAFVDLLCGEGIAAGGPITDGAWGVGTEPDLNLAPEPDLNLAPESEPDLEPGADAGVDTPPDGEPGPPEDPAPAANLWALGWGVPPPADTADDPHEADMVPDRQRWLAEFDQLPTTRPATRCVLCGHLQGTPSSAGPLPAPRPGVVEIVAPLVTLLGLANLPGELAGFGPLTADITRQVIAQMNDAQWRFSIFDPLRRLTHHGISSVRPDGQHQTNRRPDTATAAFIKARDRTCIAPGCRRTARQCDIDHTLDWVNGGETVHCNLSLLCKRHHRFKHATGCELLQFSPGVFGWTTPAGLQYLTRSDEPVLDENILAGLPKPANPDAALLLNLGG